MSDFRWANFTRHGFKTPVRLIVIQVCRSGGYGFYVLKGKPVFLYNFFDVQRTRWEGPDALTHTLESDSRARSPAALSH
jgi:hypothetical protein